MWVHEQITLPFFMDKAVGREICIVVAWCQGMGKFSFL